MSTDEMALAAALRPEQLTPFEPEGAERTPLPAASRPAGHRPAPLVVPAQPRPAKRRLSPVVMPRPVPVPAPAAPAPAAPAEADRSRPGRWRTRPRHRSKARQNEMRPAVVQPTGPHVRLGILWAAVTLGAMVLGVGPLAIWLAVAVALASASATRTWGTEAVVQRTPHNRRARVQPPAAVAAGLGAAITLASVAGTTAAVVLAAAGAAAVIIGATFGPLGHPDLLRRLVIVLGPAAGAAGLVLARAHGLAQGLVLAGMVTVFDASAYLIGTGAPSLWEGVVAGVASIGALTLFAAAVLVPPFSGATPWLLGGAAAVLIPLGPMLARWALGDKGAPVPALRRLDSLMLVGPIWAAGIALLVSR